MPKQSSRTRDLIRDYIALHPNDPLTAGDVAAAVLDENYDVIAGEMRSHLLNSVRAMARQVLKTTGALAESARRQYHLPLDFQERNLPARVSVPPVNLALEIDDETDDRIRWVPLFRVTKAELRRHHQLLQNNEKNVRKARMTIAELIDFLDYRKVGEDEVIGDALADLPGVHA